MIVKREYIPFCTLIYEHDKGGEVFLKHFKKAYPKDFQARAFCMLCNQSLWQREMEWGFMGIGKLIEDFQRLDEEEPYETRYDLEDACIAEVIERSQECITLLLYTSEEQGKEVVGAVELPLKSKHNPLNLN